MWETVLSGHTADDAPIVGGAHGAMLARAVLDHQEGIAR
jgi:hypothetical protein